MAQWGKPSRLEILRHIWNRGHDLFLQNGIQEKQILKWLGFEHSEYAHVFERILKRFSTTMVANGSQFAEFANFLDGRPNDLRSMATGIGTDLIPSEPDLRKLEEKLALKGVFELESLDAVTEMIEAAYPEKARYWRFNETAGKLSSELSLAPGEEKLKDALVGRVLSERRRTLALTVRQSSLQGTTTSALALCQDTSILASYDRVYLVQPGIGEQLGSGCERELLLVMEDLGLRPASISKNSRADELISALCEKNALLIMLSHAPCRHGLCKALLARLKKGSAILSAANDTKRRVVVFHEEEGDIKSESIEAYDCSERILLEKKKYGTSRTKQAQVREALYFKSLEAYDKLERAAATGGLRLSDTTGYRINWVRQYLSSDVAQHVTPMEVRVLALFCANRQNFSFFDATLGWKHLVGNLVGDLPLEIDLYYREILLFFERHVPETRKDKKDIVERSHWLLATAVFWLRGSVLERILKDEKSFQGLAPETTLGLKQILPKLRHVTPDNGLPNDEIGLQVPLGLKAVSQDRWMERGNAHSAARRGIHDSIAESLFLHRSDPGYVAQEFPFDADTLGSDGLYFRAEILRQKVRAFDIISSEEADNPNESQSNSDPTTLGTLKNAYTGMFRVEMNGNRVGLKQGFAPGLAHQYGAYRLSAELHQLLEPWARTELSPEERLRFLRHLAYACIDIGDLKGASDVFAESTRIAASLGEYEQCSVVLDSLLLFAETENIAHVGTQVRTAEIAYAKTLNLDLRTEVANRLKRHLATRKASYFLFSGDFESAFEVLGYRDLKRGEVEPEAIHYEKVRFLGQLSGRAGHIFVDACMGAAAKNNEASKVLIDDSLSVCIVNEAREQHMGRPHSALGFAIQKAAIYRMIGRSTVAEVTLDAAYSSMLETGGSIRTYLSLLEEAGFTLMSLGQNEKAYYLYLKRHLDLCKRLGFANREKRTVEVARKALKKIASNEGFTKAKWRSRIDQVVDSSKVLRREFARETSDSRFQAPYSGYWHPTGRLRYSDVDIYRLPKDELESFEAEYGSGPSDDEVD